MQRILSAVKLPVWYHSGGQSHYRLPRGLSGKQSACQCWRHRFDPWIGKNPWRRKWQPTPVFLPGKFHGQRSLAGYSPRFSKSWTQLSTSTHRPTECTTPRTRPNVICGHWGQWCVSGGSSDCNKHTNWWGTLINGGGCTCVRPGGYTRSLCPFCSVLLWT